MTQKVRKSMQKCDRTSHTLKSAAHRHMADVRVRASAIFFRNSQQFVPSNHLLKSI
jgi:hypothetical protein